MCKADKQPQTGTTSSKCCDHNTQRLLFPLVDTVEQAAREMLKAAAEETAKLESEDEQSRALSPEQQQTQLTQQTQQQQQLTQQQYLAQHLPTAMKKPPPHAAPSEDRGTHAAASISHQPPQKAPPRKRRRRNSKKKDPESTEKGHKRSYVEHNYQDHSEEMPGSQEAVEQPPSKSRGGITTPFPMQLHDMLDQAESRGYSHIVSWQPHGRAFHVHDPNRFVADVMPLYFRQTRMSSFQRQLSLYGFLRLTRKGSDHGSYYHELFLRGMPHLCRRMQRTRIKGYWVRQSSSPETEPDFSTMSPVGRSARPALRSVAMSAALSTSILPLPTHHENALWPLVVSESGRSSSNSSKMGSSQLMMESSLGAGMYAAPVSMASMIHRDQTSNMIPPMPPLHVATPATATTITEHQRVKSLKSPPSLDPIPLTQLSPADMLRQALPIPQEYKKHNPSTHTQDKKYSSPPPMEDLMRSEMMHDPELDEQIRTMSNRERDDMVAFLSDVDLSSGDENSVEESYEEEAKIGRVKASSRKKRRMADV